MNNLAEVCLVGLVVGGKYQKRAPEVFYKKRCS